MTPQDNQDVQDDNATRLARIADLLKQGKAVAVSAADRPLVLALLTGPPIEATPALTRTLSPKRPRR